MKDEVAIRQSLPGASVFSWPGHEEDVLGRFVAFARHLDGGFLFDTFIRLTGDCPWVDVETIKAVAGLVTSGAADFAGTNGWKPPLLDGYDVEAFSRELLLETDAYMQDWPKTRLAVFNEYREHLTMPMKMLAQNHWRCSRQPKMGGERRWTLDTPEDLKWFRAVAEEIDVTPPNHPTYRELMELEARCPELRR